MKTPVKASLFTTQLASIARTPVPLLETIHTYASEPSSEFPPEDLKAQFRVKGVLMMYVGNLERYQGIDLLIESFAKVLKAEPTAQLVVVGGSARDIQKYREHGRQYQISSSIHFIGSRPITQLKQYLDQADIVVSPRIQGNNTPMKIYSYLDSGKALLATNLATHTQVLDSQIAQLAEPNVVAFAEAMLHLMHQPDVRRQLGKAARDYIAKAHTYETFSAKLNALYDWIDSDLQVAPAASMVVS